MRFAALAVDYDGTLAHEGQVADSTLTALRKLKSCGRRLLLVTGRELPDLQNVFPHCAVFDQIVAENGALLYDPKREEQMLLGPPPPPRLLDRLRQRRVEPLSAGQVIVATWVPHDRAVFETIHELNLEHQVIFNKGAVMVLPPGVNKASGLRSALARIHLSPHNVVAVGDAENDHSFLEICGCSVAVSNALPALKEKADITTDGARGAGVEEVITHLLRNDLADWIPQLHRNNLVLGWDSAGAEVRWSPLAGRILVAGQSGIGKTRFAASFADQLSDRGYQFCIFDPEGDYESIEQSVTVRLEDGEHQLDEALDILEHPDQGVVLNFLAVPFSERPAAFARCLLRLEQHRKECGRPHWIILDEAHHLLPAAPDPALTVFPRERFLDRTILVTVDPGKLLRQAWKDWPTAVCLIGPDAPQMLERWTRTEVEPNALEESEALFWDRSGGEPIRLRVRPPRSDQRRHRRKYSKSRLSDERSFVFRGPHNRLSLRACNLTIFVEMATGVDLDTWQFHLERNDYSRWIRGEIKDDELARAIEKVENGEFSPDQSRKRIRALIEEFYTLPA